ncbi:unnamed protein product [Calicophoron daubneyi]|uniref:Protein kinase domain-containing protein n=1 Tax=Calicophoron daubneyi TaxID=300641 RepID=A0AAV2TE81_CALDB
MTTEGGVIKESNKTVPFEEIYEVIKELGRRPFQPMGCTSFVAACLERGTKYRFAVKIYQKRIASLDPPREVAVLLKLKHENIIRIKEVFESQLSLSVVMELNSGEELFRRLQNVSEYSEQLIAGYFRQIVEAIRFLHEYGIVHKNLKPENILLDSLQPDAIVKITDANIDKFLLHDMDIELVCCNVIYCAPELLLSRKFDKTFDLWSLGIILHIMLCGSDPYYPKLDSDLYRSILNGQIEYTSTAWNMISWNGKDAVKRLLVLNPPQRALTTEILKHPWVTGEQARATHLEQIKLNMKQFNIRRAGANAKFGERQYNRPYLPASRLRCSRKPAHLP